MQRLALLPSLFLFGCAAPQPGPVPQQAVELAGRVPGQPQSCISLSQAQSLHVSQNARSTLVTGGGRIVWANALGRGCGFARNDILVTEPTIGQYCRGDIVRSMDQFSRLPGPSCVLGDFVPYTRG